MVLETDCLTVTQVIRSSPINLSYLGRVIDECKGLLSELDNCKVFLNFMKRSANKVTHFTTRHNSSLTVSGGVKILTQAFIPVMLDDLKFY